MDLDPLKKELFEECSRLEQRKRILSDEVQTLEFKPLRMIRNYPKNRLINIRI